MFLYSTFVVLLVTYSLQMYNFFSGLAMTTCYWKAIWCRICLKNGFTQSLNVAATS
jgi:hypothetical protein